MRLLQHGAFLHMVAGLLLAAGMAAAATNSIAGCKPPAAPEPTVSEGLHVTGDDQPLCHTGVLFKTDCDGDGKLDIACALPLMTSPADFGYVTYLSSQECRSPSLGTAFPLASQAASEWKDTPSLCPQAFIAVKNGKCPAIAGYMAMPDMAAPETTYFTSISLSYPDGTTWTSAEQLARAAAARCGVLGHQCCGFSSSGLVFMAEDNSWCDASSGSASEAPSEDGASSMSASEASGDGGVMPSPGNCLYVKTPAAYPKTTCQPAQGYKVAVDASADLTDGRVRLQMLENLKPTTVASDLARACEANPSCNGFQTDTWHGPDFWDPSTWARGNVASSPSRGYLLSFVNNTSTAPGICLYTRLQPPPPATKCPDAPQGYTLEVDAGPIISGGGVYAEALASIHAASPAGGSDLIPFLQAQCNASPSCTSFFAAGEGRPLPGAVYPALGAAPFTAGFLAFRSTAKMGKAPSTRGTCLYVRQQNGTMPGVSSKDKVVKIAVASPTLEQKTMCAAAQSCMDVEWKKGGDGSLTVEASTAGAAALFRCCNYGAKYVGQQWYLEWTGEGGYMYIHANGTKSGPCLTAQAGSKAVGTPVVLAACVKADYQKWFMGGKNAMGGYFVYPRHVIGKVCVTVADPDSVAKRTDDYELGANLQRCNATTDKSYLQGFVMNAP